MALPKNMQFCGIGLASRFGSIAYEADARRTMDMGQKENEGVDIGEIHPGGDAKGLYMRYPMSLNSYK